MKRALGRMFQCARKRRRAFILGAAWLLFLPLAVPRAFAGEPVLETVRGSCERDGGLVRHESSKGWFYALLPETDGRDQFVEADLEVQASGVVEPPRYSAREFEFPGENDPAYDAGLILRYRRVGGVEDYYRVQIAAAEGGGEVSLWRPSGGYLAVRPFPFKEKTVYRIRAEAVGGAIRVFVAGAPVLDYHDPRPAGEGRAGIAALRGLVRFASVRHGLASGTAAGSFAPHAPDFCLKPWNKAHPGQWIFDGDEPVALLQRGPPASLEMLKLRPGAAPSIAYAAFAAGPEDSWLGLRIPESIEQLGQGASYGLLVRLRDAAQSGARADYRVVLHYDPAANIYRYDYSLVVETPRGAPWNWGRHYNFGWFDPWPLAAGGLVTQAMPAVHQRYAWVVWQSEHALTGFKRGLMQDYFHSFPEALTAQGRSLIVGGIAALGLDPLVNPAVKLRDGGGLRHYLEVCDFGYDLHFRVDEAAFDTGLPAGTRFEIKWVLYSESARSAGRLLQSARDLCEPKRPLLYPALEWPETTFAKQVDASLPHNEATWRGGSLAQGAGPSGKPGLRLNPGETLRLVGNFKNFPEELLRRCKSSVSVRARAENGTGELTLELDAKRPWPLANRSRLEFAADWSSATAVVPGIGEIQDGNLAVVNTGTVPLVLAGISFDPAAEKKSFWSVTAESLAGLQSGDIVGDGQTQGGAAVRVGPDNFPADKMIFGPYDLSLPPGDYVGLIRIRAEGAGPATSLAFDVNQTDGRGKDIPAKLRIDAGLAQAAQGYRNVLFSFHRDPGGRLNLRFYDKRGEGTFFLDRMDFERIADGFGSTLLDAGAFYAVHCRADQGEACGWASPQPWGGPGEAMASPLPSVSPAFAGEK